jgi:hypothetical protein
MKANKAPYWTCSEAITWIRTRHEPQLSVEGRATDAELAEARDELLRCCCAGRISAVGHRCVWPNSSLKYSTVLEDQRRWASAVINKGHMSDAVETIPPHEWTALEWESSDSDECSLRSTISKRRVWTRVRFLRDDLIREWQSPNAPRRGRKPKKFEKVKEAMKLEIREGNRAALEARSGKELNHRYSVSRTTATAARKAALNETDCVGNTNSDK